MLEIEFIYYSDEWNEEKSRDHRPGEIHPEGAESADTP